jgi:hypothetical protein
MKINLYVLLSAFFFILTWLMTGIYADDEFNELTLFCKHRPTFKVYFFSPIGQSDMKVKDLSVDMQYEALAFKEFVIKQKLQMSSSPDLLFIPFVLLQLTLTFGLYGRYRSRFSSEFKIWQIPVHVFINLITTTLGLLLILSLDFYYFDEFLWAMLLTSLIIVINFSTVFFLKKIQNRIFLRNKKISPED